MPKIEMPGLPDGYELRRNYRGRFYVLLEVKTKPLIIAEFHYRPRLDKCLGEIKAWETLRANVRGDNERKL